MTKIIASCTTCGDLELTVSDLSVVVDTSRSCATYAFECPDCEDFVIEGASEWVVGMLISAGVTCAEVVLPVERVTDQAAPLFSQQDQASFAMLLDDDAAFTAAIARLAV